MPGELVEKSMEIAASISQLLRGTPQQVAVAESLTSGSIACHLGAAKASSEWFLGGVVAYSSEVKFSLLEVDRGPVITAGCAAQMAEGVASLTGAVLSVAVTGAGGPGTEEGKPAGTVFIAVRSPTSLNVVQHRFTGDPSHVIEATTTCALEMLKTAIENDFRAAPEA